MDTSSLSKDQKWILLYKVISPIILNYISPSLECQHQTFTSPDSPDNFSPSTSDKVQEYAYCVLSATMLMCEFYDSVKEGDGDHVYRVWKYLMLIFRLFGRNKYALEALIFNYSFMDLHQMLCLKLNGQDL